MKKQVAQRMLKIVERRPAPDRVASYFQIKPATPGSPAMKQVTGYRWEWKTQEGFVIVSVRIKPEQRRKKDGFVVLNVALDNVTIGGSDSGTNLGRGGSHELSFKASSDEEPPVRIVGLAKLLRKAIEAPEKVSAAA